jgi:hypothetical protein
MSTPAEIVKAWYDINISSYTTTVPTLVLWTGVFVRILVQKDKGKFLPLIVICALMILS